jgi:hypothetical protein
LAAIYRFWVREHCAMADTTTPTIAHPVVLGPDEIRSIASRPLDSKQTDRLKEAMSRPARQPTERMRTAIRRYKAIQISPER